MKNKMKALCATAAMALLTMGATPAAADCSQLPPWHQLRSALKDAVGDNGGFNLEMWATVVDRDGFVCAVTFSGADRGAQWPGSRVISAQKANTANAFSLDGLALATANLYTAVQPGNSLFGLQESNPVNHDLAYHVKGHQRGRIGMANDPMVGGRIGGVNVFGGGLALYRDGKVVGGLGVSGDTSCADHNVAWRVRRALALAPIMTTNPDTGTATGTGGVGPSGKTDAPDGIVYDQASPWAHPVCGAGVVDKAVEIGSGG